MNSMENDLRFDIGAASEVLGLRKSFRCLEKIQLSGSRASLQGIDTGKSRGEISTGQRETTAETEELSLEIRNLISIIGEDLVSTFGRNALGRLNFGDRVDS
jgi:hypothetical protein